MDNEKSEVKIDLENRPVKLLINKCNLVVGDMDSFEVDPVTVVIELTINGKMIRCKNENFFFALLDLRKELETNNIQIMCNGAAENVYPSPMQLDMGAGQVAYKLFWGQKARVTDVVDIFECDESLNFVSIDAQLKFYNEWVKSLRG